MSDAMSLAPIFFTQISSGGPGVENPRRDRHERTA